MENQTNQTNPLSIDLLRSIAYTQFVGDDFFEFEGTYFRGSLEDLEIENPSFDDIQEYFEEIEPLSGDDFDNFLVLTDEEADEKARREIENTVWAFNASFIIEHSKLPYEAEEMVKAFQERCEGANDTLLALIEDLDEFVEDAISADGRGHFLSPYDGDENEETVTVGDQMETFYIYRQ